MLNALSSGRVVMDLKPGESVEFVGTGVRVALMAKSGRASRLCITSPRDVQIDRVAADECRPKHAMMNTHQPA